MVEFSFERLENIVAKAEHGSNLEICKMLPYGARMKTTIPFLDDPPVPLNKLTGIEDNLCENDNKKDRKIDQ